MAHGARLRLEHRAVTLGRRRSLWCGEDWERRYRQMYPIIEQS
jgi:hypothetical protein